MDWLRNDQARVPATAFAALWMAVAQLLDDEFFGLDRRRMKVGSFALLCHAVAGQPTVARGLRQALRGFALFLDDIEARLAVANGVARIAIHHRETVPGGREAVQPGASEDARRFADETLLVMIHGMLCWLAGRRVPLRRLQWAHRRPAHAEEYRRMFSPDAAFEQAATAVEFDARVLGVPVAITPGALAAFLRDAPQSVFLKQVQSADGASACAGSCAATWSASKPCLHRGRGPRWRPWPRSSACRPPPCAVAWTMKAPVGSS